MKNSNIEWCDHTFNPWIGCTKVSPGCAHCYAESLMDTRMHIAEWGKGKPRKRTSAKNWAEPVKWNEQAFRLVGPNDRPRVFCASLADWLDDEVASVWLADLLDLIRGTPNLDWLLLTKRPQNFADQIRDVLELEFYKGTNECSELGDWLGQWWAGKAPENVWIGTTVEDQQRADERIPELLNIPARVRFLSCEPLLGPVDLEEHLGDQVDGGYILGSNPIHWVICGGESGSNARPMHPDWARSLRDQCKVAGVPFLFKWGEHAPRVVSPPEMGEDGLEWPNKEIMTRVGKKAAGRILDGVEHNEFPK